MTVTDRGGFFAICDEVLPLEKEGPGGSTIDLMADLASSAAPFCKKGVQTDASFSDYFGL
jgi:hypothetical protein